MTAAPALAPDREEPHLLLDIDGFEGPLDLLLSLARTQKVDLRRIPILQLADQYLAFIADARRLELDVAADYLVMAAWLAYLKSRLLLPQPEAVPGPSANEMAERLAFRLQRLEAMRDATARLFARDRLGRDVFARGCPEGVEVTTATTYTNTLYDLLKAYAQQRTKALPARMELTRAPVYAIEEARHRLERMLGMLIDWARLEALLPPDYQGAGRRRTGLASTLLASLEMAKDGLLDLQQEAPFAPVFLRARQHTADASGS